LINYSKDKGIFLDDFEEIKNRYKLKSKTILPHTKRQVWIGTDHGGINIVNKY